MYKIFVAIVFVALTFVACSSSATSNTGPDMLEPTRNPAIPLRPTSTPSANELSAQVFALSGRGPIRNYPGGLAPGSPRLPPEQVLTLWEEFLQGTRMETSNEGEGPVLNFDFALCDDYTGRIKVEVATETVLDFSMRWQIEEANGEWNSATLRITDKTDIWSGDGEVGPDDGRGLFFISEAGVHYVDPENLVTFTELETCPA